MPFHRPGQTCRSLPALATAAFLAFAVTACSREQPKPPPVTGDPGKPAAARTEPTGKATGSAPAQAPESAKTGGGTTSGADAELAARVKSAITATPGLEKLAIDVTASGGAVTLYGTAETAEKRAQAGKIAASVPGVVSVTNKLVIVAGS